MDGMIFPGREDKVKKKTKKNFSDSIAFKKERTLLLLLLQLLFSTGTIETLRPRVVVIVMMKFSSPEGDRMEDLGTHMSRAGVTRDA